PETGSPRVCAGVTRAGCCTLPPLPPVEPHPSHGRPLCAEMVVFINTKLKAFIKLFKR
ncbi:hypothetical protein NDU88_008544, partial [Pleurodeles waltl]